MIRYWQRGRWTAWKEREARGRGRCIGMGQGGVCACGNNDNKSGIPSLERERVEARRTEGNYVTQ